MKIFFLNLPHEEQKETEKAMLHLLKFAKKKTKTNNLCISGGVALNCVANNILKDTKLFEASGESKKKAQQNAAKKLLDNIKHK